MHRRHWSCLKNHQKSHKEARLATTGLCMRSLLHTALNLAVTLSQMTSEYFGIHPDIGCARPLPIRLDVHL